MSENTSTRAQIVALFNEALALQTGEEVNYTEEDLTFGAPELYDPGVLDLENPQARNTRLLVEVTAEAPEGEEGEGEEEAATVQMMLHYNRLDCTRLAALLQDPVDLDEGVSTTHEALTALSAAYGIEMLEDDFEDLPIVGAGANAQIALTATTDSLGYFGSALVAASLPEEEVPDPDPAALTAFTVDHTVDGSTAQVTLDIEIGGGVDPSTENYMMDIAMENMTYAGHVNVSEGLTLLVEVGQPTAQLVMPAGLEPGTYTVVFNVNGDDGQTAASATFSVGEMVEELDVEFIIG